MILTFMNLVFKDGYFWFNHLDIFWKQNIFACTRVIYYLQKRDALHKFKIKS